MLLLTWKDRTRFDILSFLWLQQRLDEHVTQSFIWVLVLWRVVHFLWVQSLVFLSKFVDRNLSDDQREVFGASVLLSGDVALVGEFELSFLVEHVGVVLFDAILAVLFFLFTVFWFLLRNYFLK